MKKRIKNIFIAGAIFLVLCSTITGTVAYLSGMFGLTNTFVQGTVNPKVVEKFNGTVKTDVAVQNNGNVPVYIRCRVTIYKELADGSISNQAPTLNTDYTIAYSKDLNSNWILIDDIYYYKKPIQATEKTSNLIDRCELKQAGIVVDISTQSIQANPKYAVKEAWKVVESDKNGNLKKVDTTIIP